MTCELCGQPIDQLSQAWKQMTGWVSPHGAKGMTQTQPTGAVAHPHCISLLKSGVNPEQGAMV